MTNAEHFEKEKTSFNEVLRIFNAQKDNGFKSFDEFLNAKRVEFKFKVGDLIVVKQNEETKGLGWCHEGVLEVLRTDIGLIADSCSYKVKYLTPDDGWDIGEMCNLFQDFVDKNCVLY